MKHKRLAVVGGTVALILIIIGGWWISISNSLNQQSVSINQAYSNMDVQMQRRADLTPQLVGAVKGDMKNEQRIFGQIADARKQYDAASLSKDKVKAADNLDSKTQILVNAVHENYPKLASSENVSTLIVQLEGSENRITQARRDYNKNVQTYNQMVVSLPDSIIANIKGFKQKPYFQANQGVDKAPKVYFNN